MVHYLREISQKYLQTCMFLLRKKIPLTGIILTSHKSEVCQVLFVSFDILKLLMLVISTEMKLKIC